MVRRSYVKFLLDPSGFYCVLLNFYRVLQGFIRLYMGMRGFTGFLLVFYSSTLDFTWLGIVIERFPRVCYDRVDNSFLPCPLSCFSGRLWSRF